ncbi:MAG: hypothetical protein V3S55_09680 [Nitrospiraceae bacterium]
MTIVEHYWTAEKAKKRAGILIGSAEGPNPVYGLQVTGVVVVGPQPANKQVDWVLEIQTKLVELPPTFRGVALDWAKPADLDDAYQKVLEENAVLRRANMGLIQVCKSVVGVGYAVGTVEMISDYVSREAIGRVRAAIANAEAKPSRPIVPPLDSVTYPQSQFPPS